MTISDKYKFLFVEVGSAGSTSIRKILKKYRDIDVEVKEGYHFNRDEDNCPSHIAIWALQNKLPIESYYKFAFFRNPWEVAVSKFFFHNGRDVVKAHVFPKEDRVIKMYSCFFDEWVQSPGFLDMHYESKTKTMWDMVAKGDTLLVDEIFDFKNLNDSWKIISEKIGIPYEELPNTKNEKSSQVCGKTKTEHYSHYYTDKTIEIVREHFAKEIEYFGYQFDDKR